MHLNFDDQGKLIMSREKSKVKQVFELHSIHDIVEFIYNLPKRWSYSRCGNPTG